jgi:hypothetical protein
LIDVGVSVVCERPLLATLLHKSVSVFLTPIYVILFRRAPFSGFALDLFGHFLNLFAAFFDSLLFLG